MDNININTDKRLFELAPNNIQRDQLLEIFAGPELLLNLLKKEDSIPRSNLEIQLFLLKNKTKLYPYLCEDIQNNIDILLSVARKLVESREKWVRLEFISNCSLSKDFLFFFPIKRIGLIKPKNKDAIINWRRTTPGRQYIPSFSILKIDNKIFAEVELEPQRPIKIKKNPKPAIKQVPKPINDKVYRIPKEALDEISKTRRDLEETNRKKSSYKYNDDKISYSEKKIASAIKIANTFSPRPKNTFNLYEGGGCVWTVSGGGGPGTGKRR